ncbi:MAG: hypothetical protein AB1758_06900 [Candidatus Eremiobacterota bacterium]
MKERPDANYEIEVRTADYEFLDGFERAMLGSYLLQLNHLVTVCGFAAPS